MATGDITVSIGIEGGVTKTVTIDSATRVLARAYDENLYADIDTDAKWQVIEVNRIARSIVNRANDHGRASLSYTAKTFTAAT
jgi:hypothetical protein